MSESVEILNIFLSSKFLFLQSNSILRRTLPFETNPATRILKFCLSHIFRIQSKLELLGMPASLPVNSIFRPADREPKGTKFR